MFARYRNLLAVVLSGLVFCGPEPSAQAWLQHEEEDNSSLVGDWRGESVVVASNSGAKDEVVVWHIAKGKEPGKLLVNADKIVNGKAIAMGTLPFTYDKEQKAIVCEYRQGVWKLTVSGDTMKGTLTLPNKTVLRRVSLERAK